MNMRLALICEIKALQVCHFCLEYFFGNQFFLSNGPSSDKDNIFVPVKKGVMQSSKAVKITNL
ncbi:hypothetical protein T10_10617 [Trichinella papuae]|uniref:Uncharacterized protein n=1 Tax=Trichinella papuae TaxID=268474 RepID=A0A0V1MKK4_9BILA|nr:hypothetical protein T10_10617 [Trichinella papuae]